MNRKPRFAPALFAGCLSLLCFDALAAPVTHGVAAGDVDSHSAVIWARTDREATMHVQIVGKDNHGRAHRGVAVNAARDYTGKVRMDHLKPDTEYRYRVWFDDDAHDHHGKPDSAEGRFHTAPKADEATPVSFAWGGDLAGQNTCRDAVEGFPIFNAINAAQPDFFIGLGDMIYADGTCEAVGRYGNAQIAGGFLPAADLDNYWAHWKYNRGDAGYRELLAAMPYYAIWDDHEVVNDFGPLHDTRDLPPYVPGDHLLPKGLAAFLDYNPVTERSDTPKRLYRSVRWGANLELFIVDARQYRDANFAADSADKPKTMLGREQLTWLKDSLAASDATWKVIVSSVPMSIPTGSSGPNGRDGWGNYTEAGGFEYELMDILRFMQQHDMYNVVFITTDVHFAEAFRYTPFADAPDFQVHEFVSGPINAGVFPNRLYDTTLNPESLFFFGADNAADVTTWEQAKSWMNYGVISVDGDGKLTASINGIDGNAVYTLSLDPR